LEVQIQTEDSQFAAIIGIDWADRKHDVCLQVAGCDTREISILEHRPAAIDSWAKTRRDRFGGHPIAVCLELADGPIVSALLEHDIFTIFPNNPSTLARYRKAFSPSGAKDDPTDAAIALELLHRHPEKLKPLHRESNDMRSLRRLVEARRDLVQDRVRVTNRLIFTLATTLLSSSSITRMFGILFRCWVDRTPYNESRYLAALQKRHSPILKFAARDPS
jgi:hypothetical protein